MDGIPILQDEEKTIRLTPLARRLTLSALTESNVEKQIVEAVAPIEVLAGPSWSNNKLAKEMIPFK
jgi:hypothetical protein